MGIARISVATERVSGSKLSEQEDELTWSRIYAIPGEVVREL